MKRLKVLLGAYACDPTRGSEMAVGWGWATAIARNCEVWVQCAEWQSENINRFIAQNPSNVENIHFVYVRPRPWHYDDSNPLWRFCERSIVKPVMHASYRLWQRDAYEEAIKLHEQFNFDLAHQLTFVGFRFPGHLSKLGIPFVWGPIGGLENTSWRFLSAMGLRGALYYASRNLINSVHKRFLRAPRQAFARASSVMAATSGIQREIFARYGVQSRVICEVSNLSTPATQYAERTPGEALRIAWLGRHLPGKALNLLLAALARVPASVDWRLDICGDGPCQMGWRRLADKLGLAGRCTWHGQVSRDAALRVLKSAHLFVTTSLKDLTSTVVVEALASGVPVLCPDHCGFSDAITSECGIKIPLGSIDKFISNLAHKIVLVEVNEPWRRRLAAGALRRARDFSLERKAQLIEEVYTAAIARRPMTYASGALADPELVGNAFSSSTVGGGAVGDIRLE